MNKIKPGEIFFSIAPFSNRHFNFRLNAGIAFALACSMLFQSFSLIRNGWFTVNDTPGKFIAVFPAKPFESKGTFFYNQKKYAGVYFTCKKEANDEKILLEISYFKHERLNSADLDFYSITNVLDSTQLHFFHERNLEFISEKICETKGYSGREYTYFSKNKTEIIRSRVFLIGNTFYILNAESANDKAADALFTTFFNSFSPQ
ncbi:MAG: hypothetical protein IAF38_17550 [Bacteroidia bacterium]|nr:hypothetical protein [Bacteroidia bacterium]